MIVLKNLNEVSRLPVGPVKRLMLAKAELVCDGDDEVLEMMEEEFNGSLGGNWYLLEEGDDPRNFELYEEYVTDLLSDEWSSCDDATHEEGVYFVFWATNNAGGPCLFVPDEPWIPEEFRSRLEELVASF